MASSEKIKQPLLPSRPAQGGKRNGEEEEQEYTLGRTVMYYVSMLFFAIAMLYASGVPLVVCSVLQQTGSLPLPEDNHYFWDLMFPVSHGKFVSQNFTTPTGESVRQVDML